MRAALRVAVRCWWPAVVLALFGFELGAALLVDRIPRWVLAAAWAIGATWFLLWLGERRLHQSHHNRAAAAPPRPESLVPEQRVTRENELGPYWLN